MREVEPNFKAKEMCGCGCQKFGTLKKPWPSNGIRCVRLVCECLQCKASKASKAGYRDQKYKGAKKLFGANGRKHEQDDRFTCRWEGKRDIRYALPVFKAYLATIGRQSTATVLLATGGKKPYDLLVFRDDLLKQFALGEYEVLEARALPVHTAFNAMQKIDDGMRPIGDYRPFIFRAAQPRARYGLAVVRTDQLEDVAERLRVQHGWF